MGCNVSRQQQQQDALATSGNERHHGAASSSSSCELVAVFQTISEAAAATEVEDTYNNTSDTPFNRRVADILSSLQQAQRQQSSNQSLHGNGGHGDDGDYGGAANDRSSHEESAGRPSFVLSYGPPAMALAEFGTVSPQHSPEQGEPIRSEDLAIIEAMVQAGLPKFGTSLPGTPSRGNSRSTSKEVRPTQGCSAVVGQRPCASADVREPSLTLKSDDAL